MKEIIVSTCGECPFCNADCDYGYNRCNLGNDGPLLKTFEELPSDRRYEKCPLNNNDYLIRGKQ